MPQQSSDEDAFVNPYASPRAFSAPPRPAHPVRRAWTVLCSVQMALIGVGIIAAFVEIETILASGPLLSTTGCGLALAAAFSRGLGSRRSAVIKFGLSTPGISLFCLALIYALNWGPGQAQAPVSLIALLYGLLTLALCWRVLGGRDDERDAEVGPA